MASFFRLELDTKAPLVEIYAPTYTVRGINNHIEVVANEEISLYQEIYVLDSLGFKHDLIFSHSIDRFLGIINFENYPLGSATIYAKVKDTVSNESEIIQKKIEIISDMFAMKMRISMNDTAMGIILSDRTRKITKDNASMNISLVDVTRNIILSDE